MRQAQGVKQLYGFPQAHKGVCFPLWSNTTDEAASNYRNQTPTKGIGLQRPPRLPLTSLILLLVHRNMFFIVNFVTRPLLHFLNAGSAHSFIQAGSRSPPSPLLNISPTNNQSNGITLNDVTLSGGFLCQACSLAF